MRNMASNMPFRTFVGSVYSVFCPGMDDLMYDAYMLPLLGLSSAVVFFH